MKNRDKYEKELLNIACAGNRIAIDKRTMQIKGCEVFPCGLCLFSGCDGCSKKLAEWAETEYIERPKISKRDRAFLDYLKDYKYMARDGDGELYVYITKPKKGLRNWADARFKSLRGLDIGFPMVKWSDAEPWKIDDLKKLEVVDEYE